MAVSATISIPLAEIGNFSKEFQNELLSYTSGFFVKANEPLATEGAVNATQLSVAQARAYLNNCSAATIEILHEVVKRQGDFHMSDISKLTGKSTMQLRGAWGGITKRTRTVCGDPQASLIEWTKTGGGDWHGRVASGTITSFRAALDERH